MTKQQLVSLVVSLHCLNEADNCMCQGDVELGQLFINYAYRLLKRLAEELRGSQ